MQAWVVSSVILMAATVPTVAAAPPLEVVEVIATTPLGGQGNLDEHPANVQTATGDALRRQRSASLAEFMDRNLSSVFVNEAQSNPLQPDVQYRGFVGSPLLGLPQGIAVYADGVRANEPFGDTVNWALIPAVAIDTVALVPGSNPLYGLNALGGALAVRTKDGLTHAGVRLDAHVGAFARRDLDLEAGGRIGEHGHAYAAAAYLEEDGARDFSPSDALQLFAKLGQTWERGALEAQLTQVETDLVGNGPAPIQLLARDRDSVYTRPDRTQNDFLQLAVTGSLTLSSAARLTANAYARRSDITTHNGDDSDATTCAFDAALLCAEEDSDTALTDAAGQPIPAQPALLGATVNRTRTDQNGRGFTLQIGAAGAPLGRSGRFTAGIAFDAADVAFASATELGALDASRRAVPGGVRVGDAFVDLAADVSNLGAYASAAVALTGRTTLTVAGRYNRTKVELDDRIGTALDGRHAYRRFNPATGIAIRVADGHTLYAGYSESNRAPSPVELTCADEDDPCRLPNAFLADPPLDDVVARTWEAGWRGRWSGGRWHAGAFRSVNRDDILFISAGALTNEGYFANVGRTRRQGIEVEVSGNTERGGWRIAYSHLDATFRDALTLSSPNHPRAVAGEIAVVPGDRLPLIPAHLLKLGASIAIGSRWSVEATLVASAKRYFRGDEANTAATLDDHVTANVTVSYAPVERATVYLKIDNLLDRDYATFGLFGEADEVLGDAYDDPRFVSPGAPRAAWLGVQIEL